MEKLELKHLAPYLPYGVQFLLSNPFYNQIGTLKAVGLHPYEGKGNRISIFVDLPVESGRQIILPKEPTATNSICKPLLIPLSELTEEQWIEVFKAGATDFKSEGTDNFYVEIKNYNYMVNNQFVFITYRALNINIPISYDVKNQSFRTSGTYSFSQLTAFNKLFELHADVYGLLEAGLALNKLEHGK